MAASKPLKPFQGLKQSRHAPFCNLFWCFKASKTLSGIETIHRNLMKCKDSCFKASKTLSGIETAFVFNLNIRYLCFKASKTLSGIETKAKFEGEQAFANASKPLKPFQGLKRIIGVVIVRGVLASKPLKPFQGLKRCPRHRRSALSPFQLQSL